MGYFAGKVSTGPSGLFFFKFLFYLLLSLLKVKFNDLTPGIGFAPDLSQGAVFYYSTLPFGTKENRTR